MPRYQCTKTTIAPGWCEIRIVAYRGVDTPDYNEYDHEARRRIANFVLASAAGIATSAGQPEFADVCKDLAEEVGAAIATPNDERGGM